MASQKSDKPKPKTRSAKSSKPVEAPVPEPVEAPVPEPDAVSSKTKPRSEKSKEPVNPLVDRPLPKTSKRSWNLPDSWMNTWIETATSTGSALSACEAANVSMVDVNDARRDVPAFDVAFRLYEEIVDLLIQEIVRQFALGGNTNGLRYYFHVIRDHVIGSLSEGTLLPPERAETLIREALAAHGELPDPLAV